MKPLYILLTLLVANSCFGYSQQLAPFMEWKKCLGGSGNDIGNAIVKTIDGGFVIAGSSQSNNGDVSGHHGSADSLDAWLVKISPTGDIQWQRSFGGSGTDVFETVIALSDGSYICYGSTSSNDGDVSGNHGKTDIWVVKVSSSGQLVWQKCYGGANEEFTGNMRQHSDGSFYFIATTASSDGDVIGINNGPIHDIWVVRLAADGAITYQRCIGGLGPVTGYDIIESAQGCIITGNFTTHEEIFPSPPNDPPYGLVGELLGWGFPSWNTNQDGWIPVAIAKAGEDYMITYRGSNCPGSNITNKTFLAKARPQYTSSHIPLQYFGNCESFVGGYGYYMEGPNNYAVLNNNQNHVAVGTYDTIPGASSPHGDYDGFLTSITLNGNLNWKKYIGGSGKEFLTGITAISETEFIVCGYTNSNNGDVSGNHGGFDVWVVKFGTGNQVKGTVFLDMNSNGAKDANESFINNLAVKSTKGNESSASITTNGEFSNAIDTGTFVTRVADYPYYTAVPASGNTTFTNYNNTDSFSFALQPIPGKRDYQAQLFALTVARPGFNIIYQINYSNSGTDTLTNKTITLIKDSRASFDSARPAHSSISGDTIRWTINNVLPRNSGDIAVYFKASPPPALDLNDTLLSQLLIDSTNDQTPVNNYFTLRQRVTGAFDPNDKQEAHDGFLLPNDYSSNKSLLYTIRFQNTGNDTAFNIVVRDTLDANLDWNSFEMVNASHTYTATIKDGNSIAWTFTDILLPDSNVNEPASHGHITYRIKPVAGLQIGDTIKNKASIYFDYNLPIVTNTQATVLIPNPPPTPTVSGLLTGYCNNLGTQKVKITNLPAAGSGIGITVTIDGNAVPIAADSTFSFDVSTMTAGQHSIQVRFSNAASSRISSLDFTVSSAVTADVNLSANITNIINLTTPIVITAQNAAHGGTAPLYTFARERNFASPTQAESSNSTWTFDASILAMGENKIFVRMKSNVSCIVSNTVTDSIVLVRTATTGITDPDMPGQVINIYPNPFKDVITIDGLSTSKKYTISLYNLEGKQLVSKRIAGRTSITITHQHRATGIYWLSIFDENRKQLLGTVKMLKQ